MQTSRPHTEQTETRQPTPGQAAARRERSGGGAAVQLLLTAAALRAAQRGGGGNAAVTGMIARRARTTPAGALPVGLRYPGRPSAVHADRAHRSSSRSGSPCPPRVRWSAKAAVPHRFRS
ncbi:hypothetical protein [Streptomyces sp. NL15-2K]|uniref:hypothetical protein n=1 Tax=Streptomyces sp. NL15-2K TaxID=376149 RepID=UPI000F56A419|nr:MULTISPECIES: hypothetical protein [Actinomycetes]WKX11011.1 hypothetical protein Q4V64_27280 [Kutzneria buriramensis]GCB46896.1 hypothetical protein SNL152K_4198 [Streptomyces sp. NL15-2K]